MSEAKTKPTSVSVADFLAGVAHEERRKDAKKLSALFARATGEKAVMWGPSIVGFGKYHYTYESGREGDMCIAGFSPRSSALVLYVLAGAKQQAALLAKLGKHTTGKGCLYLKKLADVDVEVLEELVRVSAAHVRATQRCDTCVASRKARKKTAARKA
jgi:hypothetical protein